MSIRKTYGFHLITGNVPGAMDAVDGDDLNNGDRAQVYDNGLFSAYALNAASGAVADGVEIVAPATNAGTKRWERQGFAGVSYLLLGETSTTAYRGDRGKTAYEHSLATHTVAQGGTGRTTLTAGSFIRGAGTTAVTMSTATQATAALDVATVALKGLQAAADKQTFDDEQTIKAIINPSLDLNFGQQEYRSYVDHLGLTSWPLVGTGSKITFTRAGTGGGTYFDAMGVMQQAGANEPRIDYDPVTGECLGLLVEESRANLLTYSEDQSNAAWHVNTNMAVAASATVDPRGGTDAFSLTATADGAVFGRTHSGTSGVPYVYAIWTRRLTGTGNVSLTVGDNVGHAVTSEISSTKWTRVWKKNTPTTTIVRAYINIATSGDAVEIFGTQLEQAAFPTSYIPTTTTAITRSADVCSITSTDFSEWYRQGAGTVVCEAQSTTVNVKTQYALSFSGGSYEISFRHPQTTGGRWRVYFGTTWSGAITGPTIIAGVFSTLALTWDGLNARMQSGSTGEDITATSLPDPNALRIGGPILLNGHIRKLQYYPQRLTNVQLQALTRG